MTGLLPHQQRVVVECNELTTQWVALVAFSNTEVFEKLPTEEYNRLRRQCTVMKMYMDILNERIAAFA